MYPNQQPQQPVPPYAPPPGQYPVAGHPAQPYPNQPYPPQPMQAPQKHRPKWGWIIGISVVVVLVIIGAASGTHTNITSTAAHNSVAGAAGLPVHPLPPAGPSIAAAGSAVRDGKFEFRVTNVQGGVQTIGDNPYLKRTAQGQFVEVTLSVSNIGAEQQSFFGANQKLVDAQGRQFGDDSEAEMNLPDFNVETDVNPGNSASATVVFDIPVGDQPKTLDLHDSAFSGGVKVALN